MYGFSTLIKFTTLALGVVAITMGLGTEPLTAQVQTELDQKQWRDTVTAPKVENLISYGELVVGNPDAKVEIIEYASMTCGACANFHEIFLPSILQKYVDTGKAKFIFRNQIRDAADLTASKAAHCSTPRNAFLLSSELLARQKEWVNADYKNSILNLVEKAGIKREKLEGCVSSDSSNELQKAVMDMMEQGIRAGVTGTPTIFINGKVLEHMHTYQDLENAIEMALTMQK